MRNKFIICLVVISIYLVSCVSNTDKSTSNTTFGTQTESISKDEQSTDSSFSVDKHDFKFDTTDFEISDFKVESFKDINDGDSIFIYSNFKNKSSEDLVPDNIWQQYVSVSLDKVGIQDALYPTVLPENLLDDSQYRTAIDNSLKSVKKDETIEIGFFYKNDGKKIKITIYDNEHKIVAIINEIGSE